MFFKEAGYFGIKDRETVAKYITIYRKPTTSNALENANRNVPPMDWEKIRGDIFTTK
jgi:hypothetical protein